MKPRWILISLITVAASWRLLTLDSRSLWFDEAFSWQLTRFGWSEMLSRAASDVHPPLYYLFLKLWTALVGDSVFALRLLSVAWFLIALLAAGLIVREATPPRREEAPAGAEDPGWAWAPLFLAVSPLLFRYSQEARMYTQEVALALLSTWLLLRALSGQMRLGPWAAYGLTASALAYTHNFGLFSLAAQGVFTAGFILLGPEGNGQPPWRHPALPYAFGTVALAAALFAPWIPILLGQQSRVSKDYWQVTTEARSPLDLGVWRSIAVEAVAYNQPNQISPSVVQKPQADWAGYGMITLVVLVLVGLVARGDRAGLCLFVGIVGPIDLAIIQSFVVGRNLLETRYFLPVLALWLVSAGLLLSNIRSRPARWCLGAVAATGLSICTSHYVGSLSIDNREEYRGIADHISRNWQPGDVILCIHPSSYFPIKYHAGGRFPVHQARYPGLVVNHYQGGPIFRSEDFLDWRLVTSRSRGRIWIIGTSADIDPLERPPTWQRLDSYQVPEVIRWRGPIQVDLWEVVGTGVISPVPKN